HDLVSGGETRGCIAERTAKESSARHFAAAARAFPARRDAVDRQRGALAERAVAEDFECGGEQRAVDAGERADGDVDALDGCLAAADGGGHGIDERLHDRVLVHHAAPNFGARFSKNAPIPSAKLPPFAMRASCSSSRSRWTSSRSIPAA